MSWKFDWYGIDQHDSVGLFMSSVSGAVPSSLVSLTLSPDALVIPSIVAGYETTFDRPGFKPFVLPMSLAASGEAIFDLAGFEASYPSSNARISDAMFRHLAFTDAIVFLRSAKAIEQELSTGLARPLASTSGAAAFFPTLSEEISQRLHRNGECLGCFHCGLNEGGKPVSGLMTAEDAGREGLYAYNVVRDREGEPYGRLTLPRRPLRLTELSSELQALIARAGVRLPVHFRDAPVVQPADHVACSPRPKSSDYISAADRSFRSYWKSGTHLRRVLPDAGTEPWEDGRDAAFTAMDRTGCLGLFLGLPGALVPRDGDSSDLGKLPQTRLAGARAGPEVVVDKSAWLAAIGGGRGVIEPDDASDRPVALLFEEDSPFALALTEAGAQDIPVDRGRALLIERDNLSELLQRRFASAPGLRASFHLEADHDPAKAGRAGLYVYFCGGNGRPYRRIVTPPDPLVPALLPKKAREPATRHTLFLPVVFADDDEIQPADYVTCLGEGPYTSLDGAVFDRSEPRWQRGLTTEAALAEPAPPRTTSGPSFQHLEADSLCITRDAPWDTRAVDKSCTVTLSVGDAGRAAELLVDALKGRGSHVVVSGKLDIVHFFPSDFTEFEFALQARGQKRELRVCIQPEAVDELVVVLLGEPGEPVALGRVPTLRFSLCKD